MCKEWMSFFTFTKCSKTKRQHAFPSHSSIKTYSLHSLIGKKELWNNYGLCWTVHDLNKYVNENARLANHDLPWQGKNRMKLKKKIQHCRVWSRVSTVIHVDECVCVKHAESLTPPPHTVYSVAHHASPYTVHQSHNWCQSIFSPMFIKKTDSKQNTSFPWWTFVTEV